MNTKYKYIITLQNGDTREISILQSPVYPMQFHGDASTYYHTKQRIIGEGKRVEMADYERPLRLMEQICGYIEDEGAMFEIYRNLRNPIVELKRVSYSVIAVAAHTMTLTGSQHNKENTQELFDQMNTVAEMEAVPLEKRLEMSKAAHSGTWYSDDYTPYCGQEIKKCSMPRTVKTSYGFRCPECGNMIGWDFKRLKESPLNLIVTIKK